MSALDAAGPGNSEGGRRSRRRRRSLVIGGAAAVTVAAGLIALLIAGGDSDGRAGTLVGDTIVTTGGAPVGTDTAGGGTPIIIGGGAQALAERLGIQIPTSASVGSFTLAPGFTIDSMTVERDGDSFAGTAVVSIGTKGLKLSTSVSVTDANNWSFAVASAASPTFSPTAGLTIDPATISGSIAKTAGTVSWSLAGSTITWPVATGAQLTTQFSISNTCPLDDTEKCPEGGSASAYLGMPTASLRLPGFPNTITLAGGVDLSSDWARLEGSAGTIAFEGNGISNTQLVLWRGPRNDSYDPDMSMPDLSSLNDGSNLEFCGTFTISIPKVTNKSTGGCARWSSQGVVLAQVGGGTTVVGTMPSATATGTTQEPASAEVKGIAWTNLSANLLKNVDLSTISFSGVSTQLTNKTFTLAGVGSLPGAVAKALNIDLRGATALQFDVRGTFGAEELSLRGTIPVSITIGTEPFKIDLSSVEAAIDAEAGGGFSFTVGTSSDITLGYGTHSRTITSSTTIAAATKPSIGMVLSVNARGKPGTGEQAVDGITAATRLTRPDTASYVWPDQFGIKGLNLWNMTVQIGFADGSPQLAYSTTSYLDPQGANTGKVLQCSGSCDPSDWMISNLVFNASYTNPCFAYGFDGSSGGSSLAIDGGVLRTTVFKVGIAPAGCLIQQGSTATEFPAAFVGFQFTASFGSATLNVATQTSVDGFVFTTSIDNLKLGGFSLNKMALNVSINASGSSVVFDALTTASGFGSLAFHADMSADSSGLSWNVTGDICTDTTKTYCDPTAIAGGLGAETSGPTAPEQPRDAAGNTPVTADDKQSVGFSIVKLHFEQSGSISDCASLTATVDGVIKMSSTTYTLLAKSDNAVLPNGDVFQGSGFAIDCTGIQSANFGIRFKHSSSYLKSSTTATKTMLLSWAAPTKTLQGSYQVEMRREASVKKNTYKWSGWQEWTTYVGVTVSQTSASFALRGTINSGRVDGSLDFYLNASGDFVGKVRLYVDVPWSDSTYHVNWDNL